MLSGKINQGHKTTDIKTNHAKHEGRKTHENKSKGQMDVQNLHKTTPTVKVESVKPDPADFCNVAVNQLSRFLTL